MAGRNVGRGSYLAVALVVLAGCAQTVGSPTSTMGALTPVRPTAVPTTLVSVTATNMTGYAINVLDGRTFDLQPVGQSPTRLTLGLITVPDIGTCEGTEARSLFAQLIAGKPVTIDSAGILSVGDIPDVGLTMIQYGMAQPSDEAPGYYVEDSKLATPFSCANTTSTTVAPVVVVRPRPTRLPRTTRTTAETDATPVETPPVETPPAVIDTEAPPNAQPPNPPDTPDTVVTTLADREPVTPRTPRTPDTPATPVPPVSG